jgi:hypothetical protein
MNQGSQVQQFHRYCHNDGVFRVVGIEVGSEQRYGGANPFPAVAQNVVQQGLQVRSGGVA